jgi:alpha-beta hydrolase superfamily lysophospholipase
MPSTTFDLQASDGLAVHTHRWLPDGDVRGVVQIAHGMAEHAARYEHVADALTSAGYAVYADDHRGHGRTARTEDELGFFAASRGWATVLDDLYRLNQHVHGEHPDVPVYLFGHSMGSFLAQQFLFTFPGAIDGAILSGSTRHPAAAVEAGAALARAEIARIGPHGRSAVLNLAAFGAYNKAFAPTRTDFDWLSRDPAAVDAYIEDPRCGFVCTARMWLDVFSGLRVIRQTDRLLDIPPFLPIYVFAGDEDPVGDAGAGVQRLVDAYADAGLTNVTLRLYAGGRHEMVNETNRDEVITDLTTWLDAVTAAR